MSRAVLITGASSGIGEALAYEFARRGYRLAVLARRVAALQELEIALRAAGSPQVVVHALDLRDPAEIEPALSACAEMLGGLDIVVANAGIAPRTPVGSGTLADLQETIARLQAYANAGADCLYAPGLRTRDEIAAVAAAVAPKPVNLLVGWASDLSVADISALGVRRISIGGALARAAWGGFMRAARLIAEEGRFDGFAQAAAGNELNAFFAADLDARSK